MALRQMASRSRSTFACRLDGRRTSVSGTSQVSNLGDNGPGSLRSAMDQAPAGTLIDLRGLSGVVTLTQGPLVVRRDITLLGPGARALAISGGGVQTILENRAILETTGVTLRDRFGDPQKERGMVAAVANHGRLTLLECAIAQNRTVGTSNGAIANLQQADMRLIRCTLSGNQAVHGHGGALRNSGGVAMVRQCTFADNHAPESGGAVFSFGGLVDLQDSTFSGNTAGTGGALAALGMAPGVTSLQMRNCLVAGNRAAGGGPDISGDVYSAGGNLIGILDGTFSLYGKWGPPDRNGTASAPLDARLLPLADNGGPTLTMALLPDSPAIDVGSSVLEPGVDGFDQRGMGFARRSGFGVDVGAYELQAPDPVAPTIRIDVPPPGAVPGLYLSWPSTLVGRQPFVWPLFRSTGLQPAVPWVRVESSKMAWNPATQRWSFVTPSNSETEFFRLGNPGQ